MQNIILKDGVTLVSGSFRFYMQLPDTEVLGRNEKDPIHSKENKANGQTGGRKRKKSSEETNKREEPGPSPFSNSNRKKPAKKPTFSQFLFLFVSCLRIRN